MDGSDSPWDFFHCERPDPGFRPLKHTDDKNCGHASDKRENPRREKTRTGRSHVPVIATRSWGLIPARINLSNEVQRAPLVRLAEKVQFFDAPQRELPRGVALPEKDVPILLAAIEARATHFLSGTFGTSDHTSARGLRAFLCCLPEST